MSSSDPRSGRHRRALDVAGPDGAAGGRHAAGPRRTAARRPSLVPRSVTVVAATVGAVVALGVDRELPAPRPHPDAPDLAGPKLAVPALQPVVPAPDESPAHLAALPAGVTGQLIAGAHAAGFASLTGDEAGADVVRAEVSVRR